MSAIVPFWPRTRPPIIGAVQVRTLSGIREAVAQVLAPRPEVLAGYICGSVASGRARPDSDVDVAVLVRPAVMKRHPSTYRLNLLADLRTALQRFDVDVVLLNTAPPALAQNVVRGGTVVCERSRAERIRFQVQALNRFLDTQPMRDLHIDSLKRRYAKRRAGGR